MRPALELSLTEKCNMKCYYCPVFGDNHELSSMQMNLDKRLEVLEAAVNADIRTFRITGGEPFLHGEDVIKIIHFLNTKNITDIIVNTNGFNLKKYIPQLKEMSIKKLKVSLDSAVKDNFNFITGTHLFDKVESSISLAISNNIPIELNTVVMKDRLEDLWSVVDYCISNDCSLKLLDLVEYDELVDRDVRGENGWNDAKEFWEAQFYDLIQLVPELESRFGQWKTQSLSGGYGIPMLCFKLTEKSALTLKASTFGTSYGRCCTSCQNFPCQEGLFHISLSAQGRMTPCRLRRDLTVDVINQQPSTLDLTMKSMLEQFPN